MVADGQATGAVDGAIADINNIRSLNVNLITATTLNELEFNDVSAVDITNGVSNTTLTVTNAAQSTVHGMAKEGRYFTQTITYASTSGTADVANLSVAGTGTSTNDSTFNVANSNAIESVTLATSGKNYVTINGGTGAAKYTITGSGTNEVTIGSAASTVTLDASATTGNTLMNIGTGLGTTDTVLGGTGRDTLVADLQAAVQQIPTVTDVEVLDLTFTAAATYNASKTTGADTLTLTPSAAVNITNLAASVETINYGKDAAISAAGAASTISYVSGSASEALALNVGATSSSSNPAVSIGNVTISNNTAAMTVNSIGDAGNTIKSITNSKATSLTIAPTGQALTITDALTFAAATAITLDGTTKDITVSGAGAGDSIVADESLSTLDITSGAGTVTVSGDIEITGSKESVTIAPTVTVSASATDAVVVEDINIDANTTGAAVDASFIFSDSTQYKATGGAITINGADTISGGSSLGLSVDLEVNATGAGVDLTTNTGGLVVSGGDEQDNIKVNATFNATGAAIAVDLLAVTTDGDNATATFELNATGGNVVIDTLDLGSKDAADEVTTTLVIDASSGRTAEISKLTSAGAGSDIVGFDSITLTGAGTIKLGTTTSSMAITTDTVIDGAGFTGVFEGSFASAVTGADFNVVLGNTTGTNKITLGGGADVVVGGTGKDSITGGAGADNLSGGAGNDTITGGDTADVIDLGTGTDVLVYASATTSTTAGLFAEAGSAVGASATTAPVTTTADTITGFTTGTDKIQLNVAFGTAAATGGLIATGGTSYTTASTTLTAADFIAVNIGGTMTAVTANTAGAGRFLYDDTNDVLYYDISGDSAISTAGAYTAGAADDFVVAKGISGLVATDFIFA